METILEPALDSIAGNIEIAIYMATELENALADITHNNDKRIREKLIRLHANHYCEDYN